MSVLVCLACIITLLIGNGKKVFNFPYFKSEFRRLVLNHLYMIIDLIRLVLYLDENC